MTIADNLTALANQKLGYQDSVEACKTSLINKDVVVPVGAKLADISGLIDEIQQDPSIPVGTGKHLVTFYDFDGKVLKRQRVNTGENATAPAIPTHQFLTFAEWNNPFTNVQSDIDTGAIYNTTDGKTYLFITLTAVTGLAPTLYLSKSSTSLMIINWGDGTTSTSTTSGNQSINHVYATSGDYIITVDNSAGGTWSFGNGSIATALFSNAAYKDCLTRFYLGLNNNLLIHSLYYYRGIKSCTLVNCIFGANTFIGCSNLFYVATNGNASVQFLIESYINKYVKKSTDSTVYSQEMQTTKLSKFIGSESISTISANAFLNSFLITKYIFLSPTPPTLVNINAFTGINPICKIYVPDASVEAYKAATNWNNFSAYIAPLSQKPQSNE